MVIYRKWNSLIDYNEIVVGSYLTVFMDGIDNGMELTSRDVTVTGVQSN